MTGVLREILCARCGQNTGHEAQQRTTMDTTTKENGTKVNS